MTAEVRVLSGLLVGLFRQLVIEQCDTIQGGTKHDHLFCDVGLQMSH